MGQHSVVLLSGLAALYCTLRKTTTSIHAEIVLASKQRRFYFFHTNVNITQDMKAFRLLYWADSYSALCSSCSFNHFDNTEFLPWASGLQKPGIS